MLEFAIKYWLEIIFGLILAGLSLCCKILMTKVKESLAVKEGVLAMLHDRLCQSCLYFIDKGEITLTELNNIGKMYNAYHKLGGNGTGTELYERVLELKIIK